METRRRKDQRITRMIACGMLNAMKPMTKTLPSKRTKETRVNVEECVVNANLSEGQTFSARHARIRE